MASDLTSSPWLLYLTFLEPQRHREHGGCTEKLCNEDSLTNLLSDRLRRNHRGGAYDSFRISRLPTLLGLRRRPGGVGVSGPRKHWRLFHLPGPYCGVASFLAPFPAWHLSPFWKCIVHLLW